MCAWLGASRSDGVALKDYRRTLMKMCQGVLVVDRILEEIEGKKVEMGVNINLFLLDEAVKSEYCFRIRCYPSIWKSCNQVK